MTFVSKHRLRISLLLLLLAAGAVCAYAVWHYGHTAQMQDLSSQGSFPAGDRSHRPQAPGQAPAGQPPHPNSPSRPDLASKPGTGPEANQQGASPEGGLPGVAASAGIRYAQPLVVYAVFFLVLSLAVYWLLIHKKVKLRPGDETVLIIGLLLIGLLLRISAATLIEGHPFDIGLFKAWATTAASNLSGFYSHAGSCDYPPLYIYVLFLVGKAASIPRLSPYFTLLLKLPSMAADIATSYLIYRLSCKYLSPQTGVVLSAFYAFNPAVIINSTIWGQVDAFFTLIVAASIFALAENRIGLASALFAAAVMMKPQGIIFLPVLAFELLRQKSCMNLLKAVVIALGTAAAITLPFALNNGAPWIFRLFANTLSEYPYASVNAYNLFSLLGGNYTSDATTLFLFNDHSWGLILIVLITALGWFFYIKQHSRSFAPAVALLLIAGVFIFSTRMHERYLFPAVALAIMAFIYLRDRRLLLVALGFTATVYINTHTVFFETLKGINAAPYGPAMISTSILNLLIFAYLVKVLFDIAVMKRTVPIEAFPG